MNAARYAEKKVNQGLLTKLLPYFPSTRPIIYSFIEFLSPLEQHHSRHEECDQSRSAHAEVRHGTDVGAARAVLLVAAAGAGGRRAARRLAFDAVQLVGGFEGRAVVPKVDENEDGLGAPLGLAGLGVQAQGARGRRRGAVGGVDVAHVGEHDGRAQGLVREVVHERQQAGLEGGGGGAGGLRAVERAVEAGQRRHLVRRLEDVCELGEQVRVGGGRLDRGDEGHEALVGRDHALQCGPARGAGGDVAVLVEPGLGEDVAEGRGVLVVAVDQQQGDDLVGVGVHPPLDRGQPVGERAGVEQVARRVAELDDAVLVVDLGLQEAQAGVEGEGGVEVLVAGDGVVRRGVAQEGGVVGAHVGDLRVRLAAEGRRVVACRVPLRHYYGRRRRKCESSIVPA